MRKQTFVTALPIILVLLVMLIPTLLNLSKVKPSSTIDGNITINLIMYPQKKSSELTLDEYLVGVVAGEMPAAFDFEALKAQAIAARTYTLYKIEHSRQAEHPGSVCNLSSHCQEYLPPVVLKQRWGEDYEVNLTKIKEAIVATDGLVLTYSGKMIEPVYHASCGGVGTESAFQVWGNELPWLQSVFCPEEEGLESDQVRGATYEKKQLLGKLDELITVPVSGTKKDEKWEVSKLTPSGRVQKVKIAGIEIAGTALRSQLGLRSTVFSIEDRGESVSITTRGYGHGVGLCQEGANLMAKKNRNFQEILQHYYQGTELMQIKK